MITLTKNIVRILAFISTSVLSLLYVDYPTMWIAISAALLGIVWYRLGDQYAVASHTGFVFMTILTAANVIRNGIHLEAILLILAILAEWDLLAYRIRLRSVSMTGDADATIRSHFIRLSFVIGLGFMLSWLTLTVNVSISLTGVLICGLLVMMTLSRVIRNLRSRSV